MRRRGHLEKCHNWANIGEKTISSLGPLAPLRAKLRGNEPSARHHRAIQRRCGIPRSFVNLKHDSRDSFFSSGGARRGQWRPSRAVVPVTGNGARHAQWRPSRAMAPVTRSGARHGQWRPSRATRLDQLAELILRNVADSRCHNNFVNRKLVIFIYYITLPTGPKYVNV